MKETPPTPKFGDAVAFLLLYSNPDLRQVKAPQAQGINAEQLLSQLKESPELASALAQLLAGGKAG